MSMLGLLGDAEIERIREHYETFWATLSAESSKVRWEPVRSAGALLRIAKTRKAFDDRMFGPGHVLTIAPGHTFTEHLRISIVITRQGQQHDPVGELIFRNNVGDVFRKLYVDEEGTMSSAPGLEAEDRGSVSQPRAAGRFFYSVVETYLERFAVLRPAEPS